MGFKKRVAHPHPNFWGVPPRGKSAGFMRLSVSKGVNKASRDLNKDDVCSSVISHIEYNRFSVKRYFAKPGHSFSHGKS